MSRITVRPYDVVTRSQLPEITVEKVPSDGDPLEIDHELYFVCESGSVAEDEHLVISVIPLVVRNPEKVENIRDYIQCLSLAHRRVQFKNEKGTCDLDNCDEMIIS